MLTNEEFSKKYFGHCWKCTENWRNWWQSSERFSHHSNQKTLDFGLMPINTINLIYCHDKKCVWGPARLKKLESLFKGKDVFIVHGLPQMSEIFIFKPHFLFYVNAVMNEYNKFFKKSDIDVHRYPILKKFHQRDVSSQWLGSKNEDRRQNQIFFQGIYAQKRRKKK